MSVLDEVTFDETIGLEIQGWIMNLEGTRMDAALSEIELLASGTPFAKSDRLYRRLCGDYTQADFARTSEEDEETEATERRDKKLSEFINKQEFSERTINEVKKALAWITSALLVNAKLYDRQTSSTRTCPQRTR